MRPSVSWLPLVFVGAALFWITALGLGSWSLTLLSAPADLELDPPCEAARVDEEGLIMVQLQSEAGIPIRFRGPALEAAPGDPVSNAPAALDQSIERTAF